MSDHVEWTRADRLTVRYVKQNDLPERWAADVVPDEPVVDPANQLAFNIKANDQVLTLVDSMNCQAFVIEGSSEQIADLGLQIAAASGHTDRRLVEKAVREWEEPMRGACIIPEGAVVTHNPEYPEEKWVQAWIVVEGLL